MASRINRQSKPKPKKWRGGGPYLAAAFICENIIEDKSDGALSPIRIFDTVNLSLPPGTPEDFPSEEKRLPVNLWMLLSFKTGSSPGSHKVCIDMESPSGKIEKLENEITLSQQPHGGANIRMNTTVLIKKGGLFWFHIHLDGVRVTSIPLQVNLTRAAPPLVIPPVDPA